MNILVVGPSLSVLGGISVFCKTVISSFSKVKKLNLHYFDTYYYKNRSVQYPSKFSNLNLICSIKVFYALILNFKKCHFDYVIINTSSYWGFWEKCVLILLTKLTSKKIILIVHGADFLKFYKLSKFKFLFKLFFFLCDHVLFVSFNHYNYFKKTCISNCFHLPLPVNHPLDQIKEPKKISQRNLRYFTICILEKRKQVFQLINIFGKTFKKDSNVSLTIAGTGYLEEEIKQACSLHHNINFIGPVSGKSKSDLFEKNDIFINTSVEESFGISLVESLLSYKLCITTDVGFAQSINYPLFKINKNLNNLNKVLLQTFSLAENDCFDRQLSSYNLAKIHCPSLFLNNISKYLQN